MSAPASAPRLRLRFRTKLWIAICALVGISLALALFVAEGASRRRVEQDARERFERTQVAFRALQLQRAELLADEIDSLVKTSAVMRSVLATATLASEDLGFSPPEELGDALHDANLRLRSALPSLALFTRHSIALVANAEGELLYSASDPEQSGQSLLSLPVIVAALEGERSADLWHARDSQIGDAALAPRDVGAALYVVRAEPVIFEDEVHGVVAIGDSIDAALLRSLGEIAGVELVLYAGDVLVASTLDPETERAARAQLLRRGAAKSPSPRLWTLGAERYSVRAAELVESVPLESAGFLLLASRAAEREFYRDLRRTLAIAGAAILAVALPLGFALARGITRPLARLASAARRVGAGDFETRVEIRTGDELEALGESWNAMTEGLRERALILRTLERYVSKHVASELVRDPSRASLAGERRVLTVLFVDLGGFTELAEGLAPERLVAKLNEYFDCVCSAVLAEDGTVKEFQGDGVVAFWGAPLAQPDHAARACRAALRAAERIDSLSLAWRTEGLPAPSFRMGLHTAELVAGEIGSHERGAYGIVGDGMNLASRIEGANKAYGTRILVSDETRIAAGDGFGFREIDLARVLGRRAPVRVYELLDRSRTIDPRYEVALAAYRAREFTRAAELAAEIHGDPAARALLARAEALALSPPPPGWDGSTELGAK